MNQRHDRKPSGQHDRGLSQDFFKESFFVDGKLNPNWVGENARVLSEEITGQSSKMGATSLRNFYNEFLRLKAMPASRNDEKIILIKLLKAKTNYKKNVQQSTNIHPQFAHFMNKLIDEIDDDVDKFDNACYIFEAIIGYAKKK